MSFILNKNKYTLSQCTTDVKLNSTDGDKQMKINISRPASRNHADTVVAYANLKESQYRVAAHVFIDKLPEHTNTINHAELKTLSVFTVKAVDLYEAALRYNVLSQTRLGKPSYDDLDIDFYVDEFLLFCKVFITINDTTIMLENPDDSILTVLMQSNVDLNDPKVTDTLVRIAEALSSLF